MSLLIDATPLSTSFLVQQFQEFMQAECRLQEDVQLLQEDSVHVDVMITMHCQNWASYVVLRGRGGRYAVIVDCGL